MFARKPKAPTGGVIAERYIGCVSAGREFLFYLRLYQPTLGVDEAGVACWFCRVELDGLMDGIKPARGSSSFDALIHAVAGARQLLRSEGRMGKRKYFDPDNRAGPGDFISVADIFWEHG